MSVTVRPFANSSPELIRRAKLWLQRLSREDRARLTSLLRDAPFGVARDWLADHGWAEEGFGMFVPEGTPQEQAMHGWREVWHRGFAPLLSAAELAALAAGLEADDPALIQGATTSPPPLMRVQDWPLEGADAIGYARWKAGGADTVGEAEEFFARSCFECDQLLGEPGGCRWFLNFWDEAPRAELFAEMLTEVRAVLAGRPAEAPLP